MAKRTRSNKAQDNFGKGKVTPTQIAFIVDRYLSDNNFTHTRSKFRDEASSFLAKSPVHEAPRGLLSLGAMLNEYISLKEQKVMIEQERIRLEQERWRIHTLLQGMQTAMNAYQTAPNPPIPAIQAPVAKSPPTATTSIMVPQTTTVQPCSNKRKSTATATKAPSAMKRNSGAMKLTINSSEAPLQPNEAQTNGLAQGCTTAKRLFTPPLPCTPTKSTSQPDEITPTHCTIVAYEKITVSPYKQMASFSIERSHCISSSSPAKQSMRRRDHVKGRLDFDESDPPLKISDNTLSSGSDKEIDLFDIDFTHFEAQLGSNFNLSELLDLDCEDYSCQNGSTTSGLSSAEDHSGAAQFMPEISATLTEFHREAEMQFQGENDSMAVNSVTKCTSAVTKCTSVVSPAKCVGSCL